MAAKEKKGSRSQGQAWHRLPVNEILESLETVREQGLGEDEAASRLERDGPNRIREQKKRSNWSILLNQFTDPLIYVLLGALVVTLGIREYADALVIGAVLLINATIGFLQESKAESAVHSLMEMVSPKARVRREGKEREIESEMLVVGDIVLIEQGQVVPADIRLVKNQSFQVNEAPLTGESVPVSKGVEELAETDENLAPADQKNMAFMGTAATSGSCEGVIVATGSQTEIGEIAEQVGAAEKTQTPLQMRINRMTHWITFGIMGIALVVLVVGWLQGQDLMEMLLLAVALMVAAIPEGLPIVVTVALAIGVRRMAKRHAVIRHLPAVDTLGSCNVILSDKTGTLTQNRMSVQQVVTSEGSFSLTEEGGLQEEGRDGNVEGNEALFLTMLTGLLCNEAKLPATDDEENAGDPMEVALLVAAQRAKLDLEELKKNYPRRDIVPFRTERRYMATIHESREEGEGPLVLVKGSPERIAEMCASRQLKDGIDDNFDPSAVERANEELAANGLRVLAMAIGRGDEAVKGVREDSAEKLTFVGMQGLLDPPRESAVKAVDRCADAGIRVIMVTGDHATTAAAISKKVHIGGNGKTEDEGELPPVKTGKDLDDLNDDALRETLAEVSVFARVQPSQKLRLVNSLKDQDAIVAVTGDGVNDAPALQSAHLGAAMGSGTDVAKEASDMVITDDNFASVYAAVEEGRTAFRNIRMATFFLLSTAASLVLIILGTLVAGWPLPLLPAQILWCNVVTNGIADVALAFEPGEEALFRRKPRPKHEGVLSRLLLERLIIIGIWLAAGTVAVFYWQWGGREENLTVARTAALTTLVFFQAVHVFNCRSEGVSIFRMSLLTNRILLLGVLISMVVHVGAIYLPWTQGLLRLEPLSWKVWLVSAAVALTAIPVNELHKRWRG